MGRALLLLLLLWAGPSAGRRSMSTTVYNRNLDSAADARSTAGFFTSETVFTTILDRGEDEVGTLLNWAVNSTEPLSSAFLLDRPRPADASLVENDLALTFTTDNSLYVYKNLDDPFIIKLIKADDDRFLAGDVEVMVRSAVDPTQARRRLVAVWEYEEDEAIAGPFERVLEIYSFEGNSLELVGSISSDEYGSRGTLLPPTGKFYPKNPNLYYAQDGTNNLYIFEIDPDGIPSLKQKMTVDFDNSFDVAFSQDGAYFSVTQNKFVEIFDPSTLQSLYQSPNRTNLEGGAATAMCWSPNNDYLVVGHVFENVSIICLDRDIQPPRFDEVFFGPLAHSIGSHAWCQFSTRTSAFVISSYLVDMVDDLRRQNQDVSEQNITTFLISPTPTGAPALPELNTSPSEEPKPEGPACFPADAAVWLCDGTVARIDALDVGQCVLTGKGSKGHVVFFSHKVKTGNWPFIEVQFRADGASGESGSLRLSSGHLVYSNGALVPSRRLRLGDKLELRDHGPATIVALRLVHSQGLFNPHTSNGDILVDGLRVSTYTEAVPARLGHALLAPVRWVTLLTGKDVLGPLLHGTNDFGEYLRFTVGRVKAPLI